MCRTLNHVQRGRLTLTCRSPVCGWSSDADAPFAILSSYGKADAAVVEELSDRVPTVVYAVQVRANEPAPLMRAMAYVSDRMPEGLIRAVITAAVERNSRS